MREHRNRVTGRCGAGVRGRREGDLCGRVQRPVRHGLSARSAAEAGSGPGIGRSVARAIPHPVYR